MAEKTGISWADATFNPWVGCTKVSPACDNCYAQTLVESRFKIAVWGAGKPRVRTSEANWRQPLKWNREAEATGVRKRVFCASLADVFDNEVDPQWRADLFELIGRTPDLYWLLLTKRIGNAERMISDAVMSQKEIPLSWLNRYEPRPRNIWIGATVVNQEEADRDIPKLLATRASKRFLSIEPMLGPIDLRRFLDDGSNEMALATTIDWIICGGESGKNARPMHPDWVRSLRDQCAETGAPFHFKQWGEWIPADQDECPTGGPNNRWMWADGSRFSSSDGQRPIPLFCRVGTKTAGRMLDGVEHLEMPT